MEISDARRLKALDDENRKLRKPLGESMLDLATLKDMLGGLMPGLRTKAVTWAMQERATRSGAPAA